MSMTLLASSAALLASLAALLPLADRDPKRLRAAGRRRTPLAAGARRALSLVVLLPGLLLISFGLWPAVLIWLAALSVAGWVLALTLASQRPRVRAGRLRARNRARDWASPSPAPGVARPDAR